MHTFLPIQIGNSIGAIFPKEPLARLQLEKGDGLYVTETPDGLRITTHNPEFEEQMRVAHELMKERHAVLHELTKWCDSRFAGPRRHRRNPRHATG